MLWNDGQYIINERRITKQHACYESIFALKIYIYVFIDQKVWKTNHIPNHISSDFHHFLYTFP